MSERVVKSQHPASNVSLIFDYGPAACGIIKQKMLEWGFKAVPAYSWLTEVKKKYPHLLEEPKPEPRTKAAGEG